MWENEFDSEKGHLVITRKDGKFYRWCWYSSDKLSAEEIQERIVKYNNDKYNKEEGLTTELITDPLVREICAYREYVRPLQDIIDSTKEIRESIDDAVEKLKYALDELNRIKGLD